MGRCGSSCACSLIAGTGITITGSCTTADPCTISATGGGGGSTTLAVTDTATLDLTLVGPVGGPYTLSGVVPDGVVVPATEATQDIIGAAFGNGLVYNDAGNSFAVKISTDPNNTVSFGADGGVFVGPAGGNFWTTNTDQAGLTGQKTWDAPNANSTFLIINQPNTVLPTGSNDLLQVFHKTVKTFWLNEWGAPRIFVVSSATRGYADVALKISTRNDADTIELIRANTSDIIWKLRELGPGLCQMTGGFSGWSDFTSFQNNYQAYPGTTFYSPKCRIDPGADVIRLRGRIEFTGGGNTTVGQVMCNIPAGHRPIRTVQVDVVNSAGSVMQIDIEPDGDMIMQRALAITWISLDNITYYIGAN